MRVGVEKEERVRCQRQGCSSCYLCRWASSPMVKHVFCWYFSGGSVLSCCHHEQVVLSYEIKKNMYQQFWATCSTRHTAKGCHFQSFPTNIELAISTNLPRSARCQTRNFGIAQWMQNGHWTQTGRAGDSFYFVSQKLVVSLEWAQNKTHNGLLPNTIPSVILPTPPKCIFPVTLLVLN